MRIIQHRIHGMTRFDHRAQKIIRFKLITEDNKTINFFRERGHQIDSRSVKASSMERRTYPSRWTQKLQLPPDKIIHEDVSYDDYKEMRKAEAEPREAEVEPPQNTSKSPIQKRSASSPHNQPSSDSHYHHTGTVSPMLYDLYGPPAGRQR